MEPYALSYDQIKDCKTEFDSNSIPYFSGYQDKPGGQYVWILRTAFVALSVWIIDSADITNFEANYKSTSCQIL